MAGEFSVKPQSDNWNKTNWQKSAQRRGRLYQGIFLMCLVTGLLGLNVFRLAQLQLVQGNYHRLRAENNRLRLMPVSASRGNIFDREGKILAGNRTSHSIYLWPNEQTPQGWQKTAKFLSPILKIPSADILKTLEKVGYNSALPVKISQDIKPATFIPLVEQGENLQGVELRSELIRLYPNNSLASHVLGYIGEASLKQLKANPQYPMGMIIGQMAMERFANSQLEGIWGNRVIEVNAKGEEIQELGVNNSTPGESVKLTLDLDLQQTAEKTLADRVGAVVALNVNTGEILAMTSFPKFDPNIFTRRITSKEWSHLQGQDQPFLNRAVQGYPAGSTFKIVTSVAGMESGTFSPNSILSTSSALNIGGVVFHEHGAGYGAIGFRDALAYSSNTFFYQVGVKSGAEAMAKWGKELGIGGSINLKLLGLDDANHGQIPTPEMKKKVYNEDWYIGDTVTMSIGQGLVLVTPLELAVMVSTVANGGLRVQPHLLASQTNTPQTKPIKTAIHPETLDIIREGLIEVVKKGTGKSLNDGSIPLSGGKTGTVEIPGHPDNSMYVGFAPAERPEIAIAVIVEGGGFGAVSAAPIAHEVFKTYFQKKGFSGKKK